MKRTISWAVASVLIFAAAQLNAQTNTNSAAGKVDYLTLHLQIALRCETNADNTGDVAATGSVRITSKDIIQFLSGNTSFILNVNTNPDNVVEPHRGLPAQPTYSPKAKLLIMQPLGTNHGDAFIIIRDGGTNYIVNDYFTIGRRGFAGLTNQVVRGNANLNNPNYTASYILRVIFDSQANNNGGPVLALDVDGRAVEHRGPVVAKRVTIDPDSVKNLTSSVAGPGNLTGHFAVITGSVNASGPVKESK